MQDAHVLCPIKQSFFSSAGQNTSTGPDCGEHSSGAPAQPPGKIPTRTEQVVAQVSFLLEEHFHRREYVPVCDKQLQKGAIWIRSDDRDCTEVQKTHFFQNVIILLLQHAFCVSCD